MKKLLLSILFVIVGFLAFAQPSDATVINQIRQRFPTGDIKLEGSSTSKEQIKLVWHYYYWRHFSLSKKDASGVTGIINSSIIYEKKGASYTFHNYGAITTEVEGIKDPNKDELVKYLKANLQEYLGGTYNDIVGEMPIISIPANTKFKWDSPEQVTFNSKATYTKKISYTEIEKAEHTYETMLFKGKDGKWNRILADDIEGMKKIIKKTKMSSSDIDAMKTLQDLDAEASASAAISSLPWVEEAPVFKSDKQVFYFIHDKLMASAPNEAKAHLYKVLAKSSFQSGSILKNYVQDWVDKLINNLNSYQYTFCQYPKVKDEQEGMIYFYNKDKSRFVRMTAKEEDGTWKIKVIDYSPASQSEVNRLHKQVGDCAEKPDLEVKEKVSYKIGDIVDVKYSNGTFAAEIKKKDTNFDNRYYITFLDNGRSQWMNDDEFSLSSQKKTSTSFKVGDHVNVKTGSGTYKGTIKSIEGNNALIKWDEAGYKDLSTNLSNLTKI